MGRWDLNRVMDPQASRQVCRYEETTEREVGL